MRKLFSTLLVLLILVSCQIAPLPAEDVLYPLDKTIPQVVEHRLEGNSVFVLAFSETVEMTEMVLDGTVSHPYSLGSTFRLPLPHPISPGEGMTASFTVKKANGNTSRCSFRLVGVNDNLPVLVINEVSTKGTTSSPDRIELLVMEKGNTLGVYLSDGIDGNGMALPSLFVNKGDLIVVYWNVRTTRSREEKDDGKTVVWYLNANSPATLSGNNGVLLLQEAKDGRTMDALLYSDGSTESHSGYGSVKGEKTAKMLLEEGSWSGEPMDSSFVTSSRVFARLPGGVDSDSAGDWFITAARKSTFGERNTYSPYEE
ncbi:MAG: hypothetical protein KBS81_03160 [Spirochaetales bacterium]|nr:hypothetical protein [Candidatus Physcosoma equi]